MNASLARRHHHWLRALTAAAIFGGAVNIATAQPDPQALVTQMAEAYEAKDYDTALKTALELEKIAPTNAIIQYNIACFSCLTGKPEDSHKYLAKAIKLGFRDVVHIEQDSDLEPIRKTAEYRKTIEALKADIARLTAKAQQPVFKVVTPAKLDTTKPAPLIVALHGHGGNMDDMLDAWKAAAESIDAILVAVQGPTEMGDDAFNWFGETDSNLMVLNAIERVKDKHSIDPKRIILTGFSQGGWMTYRIGTFNPGTFKGIIPVAGSTDAIPDTQFSRPELKKTSVFIIVGAKERAELLQGNEMAETLLKKAGCKVHREVYPDIGHEFPKDREKELTRALRFVLAD